MINDNNKIYIIDYEYADFNTDKGTEDEYEFTKFTIENWSKF